MQNSHELILQALAGIRPQRMPIFDILTNDAVIEHFAGRPLNDTDDLSVVIAAAGHALDGTRSIFPPNSEPSTWTDEIGNVRVSHRWTTWLKTRAHDDVDGWASWMKKYIEENETEIDRPDKERRQHEAAKQHDYNTNLNGTVNIFCTPSTALNSLINAVGLEILSYLWADHYDLLLRWINVHRRLTLKSIEVMGHAETSPLAMIYCDVAYNKGPMYSGEMFRRLGFWDEIEEICHTCHEKGLHVIFHSDGNIMDMLADLVAAGIDGVNPIEKAAGMDIFEIRRRYPALNLVGGVDVTHLLPSGSPEEVRRETRKIITETGANGRLLIGSSTELGNDVPLDNYLAFHDEVMKG